MNQPRTQIYDVNTGNYAPDWTSAAGKLIITPVVYANQTAIALTDNAITITWKRREGSAAETALISGETVSGNVLTISANKLADVSSGLLSYIAYISYLDPDNGLTTNATADISLLWSRQAKTRNPHGSAARRYSNTARTARYRPRRSR